MNFLVSMRDALRTLPRSPAFSLTVVAIIGLGIGANAAVFSVVHAVLVRAMPYPDGDRLVLVDGHVTGDRSKDMPVSYLDIRDLAARAETIDALAARTLGRSLNVVSEGSAENLTGEFVGHAYFDILGLEPTAGRFFGPQHEESGEQLYAVLGHGLWQRRYGGRPAAVGETIELDGRSYEILGVAPPRFRGLSDAAEIWLPIPMAASVYWPFYVEARAFRWLAAVGRLAPGASAEAADAEIGALMDTLAEQHPSTNANFRAHVVPLADSYFGDVRGNLLLLWGAAGFVLMVACANVAALLLIRLVTKRRELAVRVALGAASGRLALDALAEAVVLSVAGGAAGLFLAGITAGLSRALLLQGLPSFVQPRLDGWVVATMALVVVAVAAFVSLTPASLLARLPPLSALRQGGRSSAGGLSVRSPQAWLAGGEIALAVALCVGALMTFNGFVALMQRDLGLRTEGVLTLRMDMQDERFDDNDAYVSLVEQLGERVEALPGVRAAALVGPKMPTDDWNSITVTVEERATAGLDPMGVDMIVHRITPAFFRVTGIALRSGRAFEATDRGGVGAPPVAIVSEQTAARMWPEENPVGKRLKFGGPDSGAPWVEIIGVAGDATFAGLGPEPPLDLDLYLPLMQFPARTPPLLNLMVRTDEPLTALLAPIRSIAAELAPASPPFDARMLRDRVVEQAAPRRTVVTLMSLFAILAAGLAAIGIYAVLSFAVAQQRRELGIRLALGADAGGLFRLVLGRALRVAGAGILCGLLGAYAATQASAARLDEITPLGPGSYLVAAALVLLLCAAAALAPATRAARIDPARSVQES